MRLILLGILGLLALSMRREVRRYRVDYPGTTTVLPRHHPHTPPQRTHEGEWLH